RADVGGDDAGVRPTAAVRPGAGRSEPGSLRRRVADVPPCDPPNDPVGGAWIGAPRLHAEPGRDRGDVLSHRTAEHAAVAARGTAPPRHYAGGERRGDRHFRRLGRGDRPRRARYARAAALTARGPSRTFADHPSMQTLERRFALRSGPLRTISELRCIA